MLLLARPRFRTGAENFLTRAEHPETSHAASISSQIARLARRAFLPTTTWVKPRTKVSSGMMRKKTVTLVFRR